MRTRLLVALALLVLLPLAMLAWLGGRAARGEQARLRESFEGLMAQRLAEVRRGMVGTIAATERELAAIVESVPPPVDAIDPAPWREAASRHRMITGIFVVDPSGRLVHPPRDVDKLSSEEVSFLQRTDGLWTSGGPWGAASSEGGTRPSEGWRVWFSGGGPRLLYWRRLASGHVVGAEVPGSVLVSEIVAKLPAGQAATGEGGDAVSVVWSDAQDKPVYQWGTAPSSAPVAARYAAPEPFTGWSLVIRAPDVVASGAGAWRVQWWTGLGAAALALGWLAVYLHRESTRDLRVAAQRITFVNQVSHELKTPLTNISLYAELAAERLPADAAPARECLDVVVSESARLGRLINNVLTFARHQRGALQPGVRRCDLDTEVAALVQPFSRGLSERGIRLDVDLRSGASVMTDPDSLGQILGNLLSNIEKYAAAGGWAGVSSRLADGAAEVTVADRGPGIPAALREKVFEPFFRASDRLTDTAAGTGLGLGLARELSRAMQGDLILDPAPAGGGCSFTLRLPLASK